jgi:hypothetical protein
MSLEEELIKKYIKEHLSICIDIERLSFNGNYLTVKLLLDTEEISVDRIKLSSINIK